jgi:hypothetical protein
MSPIASLASATIAMLASFVLGFGAATWKRTVGHAMLVVFGCILALKIFFGFRPDHEIALLGHDWYILHNGAILYACVCGLFGCALALVRSTRDKRAIAVLALVVAAHGVYMCTGHGLHGSLGKDHVADSRHHLRQSSPYSCGAAVCVVAASYLGQVVSEAEMIDRCLTNRRGTSLLNIYRGMMLTVDRGAYHLEVKPLGYQDIVQPGRISLAISGNHAICLVGRGDEVVVHDTNTDGPEVWDQEDVEDRCDRVCVTITRR